MFKKTIIALSLAGLASTSFGATVTATNVSVSAQGMTTSTVLAGGDVSNLNAIAVAAGSTIQVAYSAAPTNAAAINATTSAACGTAHAITYAGVTGSGKVLNYTVSSSDANLGAACVTTFGATTAPLFAKADVEAAPITVSTSWTVVGTGVDPGTAKPVLTKLATPQFGITVATADKADAVVNVNAGRKDYVGGGTDVITVTYADLGGQAVDNKSTLTINGNFAWADDPLIAGFQILDRNGQTAITAAGWAIGDGTTAAAPTATALTVFKATPAHGNTAVITFEPLADANLADADATNDVVAVALPNEAFTVSQVVNFTDIAGATTGTQATAAISAGAWGLNGASVKVFSVPFGAEVESHSLFVSNSGTSTGALTASVAWNGNAPVTVDLGNVQSKANKYINLIAAMTAAGNKPAFGRADVTFTVNAPAADITFTAGYTTAAGRANLFMVEQANMSTIANAAKTSSATAATDAAAAHAATDIVCSNLAAGTDGTGTDTAGDSKFKTTACP